TLVCVAFYMDWVLAIIGFVVFPVSVLPVLRLSKRLRRYSKSGQATLGNLTALLQETIQGNRIVKAFGMEQYELERFGAENRRLFGLYMKASRAKALIQPIMEMLAAFGIAGVVLYGGYSVINGGRTQGDFLAFLTALVLVYDPFKGLAKISGAIQQGLASAERVCGLPAEPRDARARAGARALPPSAGELRFENVSFRYPPRVSATTGDGDGATAADSAREARIEADYALRDIDLVLRRGEAVALVG